MCGIAGIYVKDAGRGKVPVNKLFDCLLLNIEHRGYDATGMVSVGFDGKQVTLDKNAVPASEFIENRRRFIDYDTRYVLGHTRLKTKGTPKKNENNHPVMWGTCFATHNGHISNDDELVKEHGPKVRPADVDSIAIPIVINKAGLDDATKIKQGLEQLEGGMAVAIADPIQHPSRVVLAKGSHSPLWILNHPYAVVWASERLAIKYSWEFAIGTAPSYSWSPKDSPKFPDKGWYDLVYGEFWILDNGKVLERAKFTPKSRAFGNYENNGYRSRYRSPGQTYTNNPTYRKYDVWAKRWYREEYSPGCQPNWRDCASKCEIGCATRVCDCSTITRIYEPVRNHSVERDKQRQKAEVDYTAAADSDYESCEVPDGKIRCDGCWDWYASGEIFDSHIGTQTWALCADCYNDEYFSGMIHSQNELAALPVSTSKDNDFVELSGAEVLEVVRHTEKSRHEKLAEAYEQAHKRICNEVAKNNDTTPAFVEWILFKAELEDLEQDTNLIRLRDKFDKEYAELDEGIHVGGN